MNCAGTLMVFALVLTEWRVAVFNISAQSVDR
jgi:hypothetical protein